MRLLTLYLFFLSTTSPALPAGLYSKEEVGKVASDVAQCSILLSKLRTDEFVKWAHDLKSAYQSGAGSIPESMPNVSVYRRIRNQIDIAVLRTAFKTIAIGERDRFRDHKSLRRHLKQAVEILNKSWWGQLLSRRTRASLIGSTNEKKFDSTLSVIQKLIDFQQEFEQDVIEYKKIWGEEFFTKEALARGAINSLTMKLFAYSNGKRSVPHRHASNALALLHPVTDEALDKRVISKATTEKLSQFLDNGVWPKLDTAYENLLFGLLHEVYKVYPIEKYPDLNEAFRQMHRAQERSLLQQSELSEDELLDVTLIKGGLSTTLAGYLALGGLTEIQAEFFFKTGAVFQIMDDLMDMNTDFSERNSTVWTKELNENRPLVRPMSAFLATEAALEKSLGKLTRDFDSPDLFSRVYRFAFVVTLIRALSRSEKYFDKSDLAPIKSKFPFSLQAAKRLIPALLSDLKKMRETNAFDEAKTIQTIIESSESY